jgi:photosystem II stability/assembly factor-like uncharacterized protein
MFTARVATSVMLCALAPFAIIPHPPAQAEEPAKETSVFKNLKYRMIGPYIGGRVSRVAGVPGDPLVYYAATASGGVWKSGDGGNRWQPIFDAQPISSIGSIAVAASDPNVIYVGSGEANIRGNVAAGNGIYKSTDAGKNWQHVWKQEGQIGTMLVHPTNPDIAFAAVLGHAFGPNKERGVYRTVDGGKTWQQVLARNVDTGASDVCLDPSNPRILFAGLWQARRRPWEMTSGGPGSGLFTSRDGGDTWKELSGNGLPDKPWGKIGVAVAPSDGRRVYALIEAEKGGMFRSDDGGENWKLVSGSRALRQRAWYYSTITVDPHNADVLYCPNVPLMKSIDGGKTWTSVKGPHHGDHHDLWIDPKNPKRMIDANDGGVDISTNGGETWFAPPLPICQFYHINVDTRVPYHVSGTMQDIGCAAGPSNSLAGAGIGLGDWYSVGGGETGYTAHDPTDPNIVHAGEYGGYISRFDLRTRQARNVSIYPENPSGHGAEALKHRFRWPAPILMSPRDPKTIYHAANVIFKSTNGGQSWTAISGDLTRNDKSKQRWSGGPITGDNTTAEFYCTISSIAEAPKPGPQGAGVLWVGSDDGLVHVSKDGGRTWTNVTAKIEGFPEWGTVKCIEASPHEAGTAYVVVDAHMLDDKRPYLFKTADYGETWKSIAANLAPDVYLHVVREDPRKKGMLYIGTERGVSFSTDDGVTWQPLKLNLPTVAVHDMVVKNDDLVLGTNGRSIWILDDLTPIREWTPKHPDGDIHLFAPAATHRWQYHYTFRPHGVGQNPPPGATIQYWLKNKPEGDVTLEILDGDGKIVNTLSSKPEPEEPPTEGDYEVERDKKKPLPKEPGLHRVHWNLQHKGATRIKGAKADMGDPTLGFMVIPGFYTARLQVDGKIATARFEVRPDARVSLTANEWQEQEKFVLGVRDEVSRLAQLVMRLQNVRKQLRERNEALKDSADARSLVEEAQKLISRIDALEERLHNPKAQVAYDILAQRGGAKLYSRMILLYAFALDGDGVPTQGQREVFADQSREFKELDAEWNRIVIEDLAGLNRKADGLKVPHVVLPR